jgi:FLVCR family MFS transporter 7
MHIDHRRRPSTEHLLPDTSESVEMQDISSPQHVSDGKPGGRNHAHDVVVELPGSDHPDGVTNLRSDTPETLERHDDNITYRVYKVRFFGLAQLVLLNIVVSWDWLTFSAVSTTSAQYFGVSESTINWLSTGFLFAFVAVSPLVMYTLNKGGPKAAIVTASVLVLVGNWIRYAGSRATDGHFGVVMFGQIIIGFAQPFVLSAPTRYSNLWFSDNGRVSATAVASLANPLGAALGQLVGPFWATDTSSIPSMVLYTSIISTVASLPSFFIPAAPKTPPSAMAVDERLNLREALHELPRSASFYLILLPFSIYVGLFNAVSSLINQIFEPYGFSEDNAGIAGALLIVVGLVASAIVSPYVDNTKRYLPVIKTNVPLIAVCYLALIWMPQTRTLPGPYIICSLLGATSFSLLPCALEYLVIITHPVSPEISSTICWSMSQLFGAIFIIIMDALKGGLSGEPDGNMKRALIFQAAVAWVVVPLPLALGFWRFQHKGLQRLASAEG